MKKEIWNWIAYLGDCLEVMDLLIQEWVKVDAIITDIPYWTTACKWDTIIPFDKMWERLNKLIKPNGAIVLFWSQPFTSALIMSNTKMFRHQWIWNKKQAGNPFLAKLWPLKIFEDIIIFSNKKVIYNPQMRVWKMRKKWWAKVDNQITWTIANNYMQENNLYNPEAIIDFSTAWMRWKTQHPTQKPVALMEYLIKTYTQEWELVLDFTAGSFSTCVWAENTNRKWIGIERDENYFNIWVERINNIIVK